MTAHGPNTLNWLVRKDARRFTCGTALNNRLFSRRVKLTIINTCIKPCITYGMEIWAPPPGTETALEMPVRNAMRTALGVPGGQSRTQYPVDLLHFDTAVRPVLSDARAAHVRYWQRVRTLPTLRLQRRALDMLPAPLIVHGCNACASGETKSWLLILSPPSRLPWLMCPPPRPRACNQSPGPPQLGYPTGTRME